MLQVNLNGRLHFKIDFDFGCGSKESVKNFEKVTCKYINLYLRIQDFFNQARFYEKFTIHMNHICMMLCTKKLCIKTGSK